MNPFLQGNPFQMMEIAFWWIVVVWPLLVLLFLASLGTELRAVNKSLEKGFLWVDWFRAQSPKP